MTDETPSTNSPRESSHRSRWELLWPRGSLGFVVLALVVAAAVAHERDASSSVKWTLTVVALASAAAAVIWCCMPLLSLQRDPILRKMGLTPWPISRRTRQRTEDPGTRAERRSHRAATTPTSCSESHPRKVDK
jgi:hypothetical protein